MAGVEQHNYNIIQLDMFDGVKSYSDLEGTILPNGPAKIIHRLFAPVAFNALALPRLLKTTFPDNATTNGNIIPSSLAGSDAVFDVSSIGWVKPVNSTGWIKLSSTPLKTDKVHTIKIESGLDYYKYAGEIFEACIRVTSNNPYTDNEVSWGDNVIRGVELDAGIIVANWSMWKNIGYDCWDYLGQISGVNINNFDFERNGIAVTGVDSDTDVILATDQTTLSEILSATQRFALWNNSHIMGISQRAFCDTNGIVYKGSQQLELSNFNYYSDPVSGEKLTLNICYLPLMTLDFTGLRRIPMPLPMIRRAMRNPQHLTTAGGKVYSVEDNKIWVGSVDDFMMTDFIEIHSAVDHIASMDTGIVVSTRQGLFYVASGEGIKRVIGGEMIMSKFLAPCSGGVLSVDGRDIHIIYKQVTDSGAWYPSVAKINNALTEINLEGEIKSVSIGDMIYIADDWNVWIYDMANKVWAGKKHYKNRIHRLFGYKNKLGVAFETGVNRRNSFPLEGGEKS